MKVRLKLFATLDRHLPPGAAGGACDLDVPPGTQAQPLLAGLGLPVDQPGAVVVLVNGRQAAPGQVLHEGDVLSAFPAVGGG